MAANTRRANALEFGGRTRLLVTTDAGGRGVLAFKREGELVMVELGVAVYPIVAGHTVRAEIGDVACDKVGLIPDVAVLAQGCRKRVGSGRVWCLGQTRMAVGAAKRLTGSGLLVCRQREAQCRVVEVV